MFQLTFDIDTEMYIPMRPLTSSSQCMLDVPKVGTNKYRASYAAATFLTVSEIIQNMLMKKIEFTFGPDYI